MGLIVLRLSICLATWVPSEQIFGVHTLQWNIFVFIFVGRIITRYIESGCYFGFMKKSGADILRHEDPKKRQNLFRVFTIGDITYPSIKASIGIHVTCMCSFSVGSHDRKALLIFRMYSTSRVVFSLFYTFDTI